MADLVLRPREQYRVLAGVSHIDFTMESGQYTADIKLEKWKRCDNSRIYQSQEC